MRLRYKLRILFLLFVIPGTVSGQSLNVRLESNQLRIIAPNLHFLVGDTLRQLRNGASVNYVFQAAIGRDRTAAPIVTTTFRFVVSYDLWEEKYAVRRLEPLPRSASNLSVPAVESWCLDSLLVPVDQLGDDQQFWIRLDYRVEQPSPASAPPGDSGLGLATLIDIFSRRSEGAELGGTREGGPFRLVELRRAKR